jgi:hypothetical protein
MGHFFGAIQTLLLVALLLVLDWHQAVALFIFVSIALSGSFLACCYYSLRGSLQVSGKVIIFWAVIFRLVFIFDPVEDRKLLSTDVYRYFWEGRVVAEGENPYYSAPNSPELKTLRKKYESIFSNVSHLPYPTIYPPGAQLIFGLLPPSKAAYRWLMLVLDMILILILARWLQVRQIPPESLIFYAWLPLPIIELMSSMHLEGFFLFLVVAGGFLFDIALLRRYRALTHFYLGSLSLSLAVIIKFVAVVPLFFGLLTLVQSGCVRLRHIFVVTFLGGVFIFLLSAPFFPEELSIPPGFIGFGRDFRFNGPLYVLLNYSFTALGLELLSASIAKGIAVVAVGIVALGCVMRRIHFYRASIAVFLTVLLFSPLVYPWYLLWFSPFVCLLRSPKYILALLSFQCSSLISYEVLAHPDDWNLSWFTMGVEYIFPLIVLAACGLKPSSELSRHSDHAN